MFAEALSLRAGSRLRIRRRARRRSREFARGGVGFGIGLAPPIVFILMKYRFYCQIRNNRIMVSLFTALVLGDKYTLNIFIFPF